MSLEFRASAVAMLALCSAACGTRLRGAPSHAPEHIYEQTREQDPQPNVELPTLAAGVEIVVLPIAARHQAPTGLLLSDEFPGSLAGTFTVFHLEHHLTEYLAKHLAESGAHILRAFHPKDLRRASADANVLRVELSHLELHRWEREKEGLMDLARMRYSYAWGQPGNVASPSLEREEIARLQAPDADDLEALSRRMAHSVLISLVEKLGE